MLNGDRQAGEIGRAGKFGFRDVELTGEFIGMIQFFRHQSEGNWFSRRKTARVAAAFLMAHSAYLVSVALIVVDVRRQVKGFCQRMSTIGERILKVRKASGLSQEAFGRIGGVGRQTQIAYEKGDRSPDAPYFAGIYAAGYDVLYMITGQPLPSAPCVNERRPSPYSPAEALAAELSALSLSLEDAALIRSLALRLSSNI